MGKDEFVACMNRCGDKFVNGILNIYSSFYKQKVGNHKEYKALKDRL